MGQMDSGADAAERFVRRLCDDHGDAVFGWALGRFADRRDAEEVVSETMVRAWRHYEQFDPERGTERAWVFGIARNAAADHFRGGRRHLRLVLGSEAPEEIEQDEVDRVAESTLIQEALGAVSAVHREVLVLVHYGGLSTLELAARLGVPVGTVKSRLYYATRSLRAALEERGILR